MFIKIIMLKAPVKSMININNAKETTLAFTLLAPYVPQPLQILISLFLPPGCHYELCIIIRALAHANV